MVAYRAHGRGKPDMTVGSHAYYIEVEGAASPEHAERIAGRHRTVARLSWWHMITSEMDDGRWLVKVAYSVDPA